MAPEKVQLLNEIHKMIVCFEFTRNIYYIYPYWTPKLASPLICHLPTNT